MLMKFKTKVGGKLEKEVFCFNFCEWESKLATQCKNVVHSLLYLNVAKWQISVYFNWLDIKVGSSEVVACIVLCLILNVFTKIE